MNDIKEIIRKDIQQTAGYKVSNTPEGFIKLDAMEFPYELPAELKQELAQIYLNVPLRLYPNIATDPLIAEIKRVFAVPESAELVLGNGSDELIQLLALLVAEPERKILSFDPTFQMYQIDSKLYHMQYLSVDCDEEFQLDFEQVFDTIRKEQPQLIYLSYPNNPTGVRYERQKIEKLIKQSNALVVIDEAYGAFSSDSFLDLAGEVDNLIVTKTFSKIGFAGIRLGFAAANVQLIEQLRKITPPYNMNQLTLATAKFILNHFDWVTEKVNLVKYQREIVLAALEDIELIKVFASETNFLTLRVPDAKLLFDTLYQNKILVKMLHGVHPTLNQCIRITIGQPEQNKKVVEIIKQVYGNI